MTNQKSPNTNQTVPKPVASQNEKLIDNMPKATARQAWVRRFWPLLAAVGISMIWVGICVWWFMGSGKLITRMPVYEAGGLMAGASLPLILVWLIALVYLRTDPLRDHRTALTRGLDDLLTPLDTTQKRVNSIVAELHKQIKHVEVAGDVAATRIDNLENRFQEQISNLFEVTTDAEAKAVNLQEKLSSERDSFSCLVKDTTAQITELETLFKQIKFDSETIANTTRKSSEDLSAEISFQNGALDERSRLVGEQLEIISGELGSISREISENCSISENKLGNISQLFSERQADLSKSLTGLSDHTDQICDKMDNQSRNIAELSQKTADQSEKITVTLLEQSNNLSTVAADAINQTIQSGEIFQAQAQAMSEKLDEVTEKSRSTLSEASDFFKENATGIIESSQTLADSLIGHMRRATSDLDVKSETLEHTISVRTSTIEEALDKQAEIIHDRLENSVLSIEGQAKRVDEAVKLTADNLNENTNKMNDHCSTFEQMSEKFRSQIDQSELQLKTQHDDLIKSLSDMSEHLEDTLQKLKDESGSLGEHSQQVISNIVGQTEQLSEHIDNIRDRTENTIRNIQEMGETVNTHFTATDTQATSLSENWIKTASLVENQCADTLSRLDNLTEKLAEVEKENTHAAEITENNISKVTDQMQHASESIYLASASATEAADETNRIIDGHAEKFQQLINALQLSNKSILIDAEAIEQKNRSKHGSHFSNLASKIIEQLQSLSIDINRYFEDDVPDKIWQSYVAGDKNAFVRRLKKMTDKKYTDIIGEKYKSDPEFRKNALEYIQIFEDLMSQSMASDSYSTFSVALISSETGKIYLALAQATGRFAP